MKQLNTPAKDRGIVSIKSSGIMITFGLVLLALIVAIDRPQWFHLRPASGTAVAMSNAGAKPAVKSVASPVATGAVH